MFERFRQRSHELERLDTGDYTPAEYARWEGEMRWIHGILGEKRALRTTLLATIRSDGQESASVLDVGAGTGGLVRFIHQELDGHSGLIAGVEIDGEGAIAIARTGLPTVRGDGLGLPFADDSFDHAYCTLVLHHLEDDKAIMLLKEMARVARREIFVVDLNRDALAYFAYRAIGTLFLQKLTLEDGALSILRSRTADELRHLAADAGLSNITVTRSRVNRLVLSARK